MKNNTTAEASKALVDIVKNKGLQAYEPPAPLPQIDEDEIHLICWLAVDV